MWGDWYVTDTDCSQYMRKSGLNYEMIQAVWLDRTVDDKADGVREYVVVKNDVHLSSDMDDEIIKAIAPYGYTIPLLIRDYGEAANDVIAECILEESSLRDGYIVGDFDSFQEAEQFIKQYCEQH